MSPFGPKEPCVCVAHQNTCRQKICMFKNNILKEFTQLHHFPLLLHVGKLFVTMPEKINLKEEGFV